MFAMPAPLALRPDYDGAALRLIARSSADANQTRRLLALASLYEGSVRLEAARQASVTPQIVRDWVARFNADGPDGLIDRTAPGRVPKLNAEQLGALLARVEAGPMPAVDGVVRWRIVDLVQWVFEEFRVSLSPQTMSRVLRQAGYRKLSARPRHQGQDPDAIETFKKTSQPRWRKSGPRSNSEHP
jgi:transposase